MKPISREEMTALLRSAVIKPRLVKELRFVPEEIHDWQDRDFLAVTDRNRKVGVLLYPETGSALPFTLQRRSVNAMGRVEPIVCDICATWRRGTESAIITFQRERSSVSYLCCDDLLCSLHVRDKTEASRLSRTQLRENISPPARIERLQRRLKAIITGLIVAG